MDERHTDAKDRLKKNICTADRAQRTSIQSASVCVFNETKSGEMLPSAEEKTRTILTHDQSNVTDIVTQNKAKGAEEKVV